ncbi:MAG: iron ABC transporter permease [Phycisphaerales bacterium]|jgi:iron complex transport system permease protein|nr:iron ABC transporter permease [Phycisphaerales bacterium]
MTPEIETFPGAVTGRKLLIWVAGLSLALIAVLLLCSLVGQHGLKSDIWRLRLCRGAAAAVVGISLAVAGLALQALLRNPLAEPYILGISSGAGVGVLCGLALATYLILPKWASSSMLAMIGGLTTAVIVYAIAHRRGKLDPYVLLLAGVMINVFNGALILVILQFTRPAEMINFIGWGMGKVPEWIWSQPALLIVSAAAVLLAWLAIFARGAAFNTLGLGDAVASSAGVSVGSLRIQTFVIVSLMTAMAVSLAGPIGFVGLIVPHVCRMLVGPDHRLLIIVSGFAGAMFLILADTLCRLIDLWTGLGELPVGVITAMSGGPFFIYLLRTRRGGGVQ